MDETGMMGRGLDNNDTLANYAPTEKLPCNSKVVALLVLSKEALCRRQAGCATYRLLDGKGGEPNFFTPN